MTEHLLSTLGLALRAGAVAVGEEPVGAAARAKKARVIFTARDKPGGRKLIEKVIQPDGEGVARIPFMTEDTADLKPKG